MSSKLQQTKGSTTKGQNDETYSDGTGRIKFTEDGLETEVRLLSEYLLVVHAKTHILTNLYQVMAWWISTSMSVDLASQGC